jgi:hypothetical protein
LLRCNSLFCNGSQHHVFFLRQLIVTDVAVDDEGWLKSWQDAGNKVPGLQKAFPKWREMIGSIMKKPSSALNEATEGLQIEGASKDFLERCFYLFANKSTFN